MADNSRRDAQVEKLRRYADLIARESGKAVRPYRADGFVNLMNKYGTSKDPSEQYRYVPELQVPDSLLTLFYEGNGLFAKIIDAPAEEAVKHGFTLEDVSDQTLIDFYQEALEELDFEETAMTAIKWARLYGGSIAVMLINDGRGLEEPLDWSNIRSIDDIRVYDRSVIQPDYDSMFSYDPGDPFRTRGSRLGMPERYQVFSKYGTFTVHDSRCLVFRNGVLPEGASNSVYQFWGQPEYVRINKAIRDAEVAHGSAPKLLDRSVQAIYKMRDLSAEIATEEGEDRLLRRLQLIDMARGMMNSIAIDSEGEDYDFKTFQFTGVNDVIGASCNMLSAVSNIPQVILFGQKVGGLGNGDDTSMENWYNYVERNQKRMLKGNTRYLLSIIFQAGLATGEVDEVPKIKVSFNPLWSMSDTEKADLELKREQVKLAKAQTTQVYVSMQALDPTEVRKKLADSDEYDVEKILDEYEDEDLFPPDETPSPDGILLPPGGSVPEQGSFSGYAEGVDLEAHNADPQEEGNGPDAAPAATKLPQDMSQEELETAERRGEKLDSGGLEDFYAALKRRLNTDADNDINESVGVSNFDKIATVDISIASPVSSDANFGNLLILGPAPTGTPKVPRVIPKVGVYGSLEEVQEAGFITNGENPDPVGVAARVAFSQTPVPTEVYIAIQQKAEGASGAAQTILEANSVIEMMVGKQAGMAGCSVDFDEDARRIHITLTGPGSDMQNTGIVDTISALVEKKYVVSVDGEEVTDLDSVKGLPVFSEITAMEKGGEDIEIVATVEHDGALPVSYGVTVSYPDPENLRVAAENEMPMALEPIDTPDKTLEIPSDTAARALNTSGWYVLCTAGIDSRHYEDIASYIETTEKMFLYTELGFFGAGKDGENQPSVGNVYLRTGGIYGRVNTMQPDDEIPEANLYLNVAMAAAWLHHEPGSETTAFKRLSAVYPSDLSSSEMKALEEAHLNYFIEMGGKNITMNGQVVGNEWCDIIRFRDWLKDDMQTRVVNLFVTEPKVPYTDSGIAKVENQMRASLARGQEMGGIAEEEFDEDGNSIPGFVTSVPRSSKLTASEKASRKLKNCKFTARLAGAIHHAAISGTLTYENL